jgi:hypothetical protein
MPASEDNKAEPTHEYPGTSRDTTETTPTSDGQIMPSNAAVAPISGTIPTQTQPQTIPSVVVSSAGPSDLFKFDSFHPRLKCPKRDCNKMTSCWGKHIHSSDTHFGITANSIVSDSSVVICPRCGPRTYVRYCSKDHLYTDLVRHWTYECGMPFVKVDQPIDEITIRPNQTPRSSYIFGHMSNLPERHRQAVWRAMEAGDYFIFDDARRLQNRAVLDMSNWNQVRCHGKLLRVVHFADDGTPQSKKRVFNHHINQCLMFGMPLAENSCKIVIHMIREALIVERAWDEDILTDLCMQVAPEWGMFRVPPSFYNVDFVNYAWQRNGLLPPFAP